MGGIATDAHGRTNAPGVYAVGEVASTGLHGANRLASNSLLEAVVFGARVAEDVIANVGSPGPCVVDERSNPKLPFVALTAPSVQDRLRRLRATMTANVGVERTHESLTAALRELSAIASSQELSPAFSYMHIAAECIAAAALAREESRGGHYRTDCPRTRADLAQRSRFTYSDIQRIMDDIAPTPRGDA